MKLNSDGVTISILILILMILTCHSMNYLFPKNKFENVPQTTNYNTIYYSNKKLCDSVNKEKQPKIPCDVLSSCIDQKEEEKKIVKMGSLDSLSESELAVLYKVVYEDSAREIFLRTLGTSRPTQPQQPPSQPQSQSQPQPQPTTN